MNLKLSLLPLIAAAVIAGCNDMGHDHHGMMMGGHHEQPTAAEIAAAKDMHNTVCPISGDKTEDSKVVAIHDGKLYHLCCEDCVEKFNDSPDKYIKMMDANPSKYGLKP